MSEPGHNDGFLEYYEYIMPGTYLYPVAATSPTFAAYVPSDEYLSSYSPVTSMVTYVPSPSPFGLISYLTDVHPPVPNPQRTVYVVQEEDVYVHDQAMQQHLQYSQAVQETTQKSAHEDHDDAAAGNLDTDQITCEHMAPKRVDTTNKNHLDLEPQRKRIYRAEQGYLVEEPSSEPSEEQ